MRHHDHDEEGGTPDDGQERKTIEAWGEAKGLWPQGGKNPKTRNRKTEFLKFATAKAHKRWNDGQVVTEKEFDDAVTEASSQVHR